jgi:hypothetical protein
MRGSYVSHMLSNGGSVYPARCSHLWPACAAPEASAPTLERRAAREPKQPTDDEVAIQLHLRLRPLRRTISHTAQLRAVGVVRVDPEYGSRYEAHVRASLEHQPPVQGLVPRA